MVGRKVETQREAGTVSQMQSEAQREHQTDGVGVAETEPGVTEVVSLGARALPTSGLWQVHGRGAQGWAGGGAPGHQPSSCHFALLPPGLSEQPPQQLTKAQDRGGPGVPGQHPGEATKAQSREDASPHLPTCGSPSASSLLVIPRLRAWGKRVSAL